MFNKSVFNGCNGSEFSGFIVNELEGYNRIVLECFYISKVKGYSMNAD